MNEASPDPTTLEYSWFSSTMRTTGASLAASVRCVDGDGAVEGVREASLEETRPEGGAAGPYVVVPHPVETTLNATTAAARRRRGEGGRRIGNPFLVHARR